jgi:hypothetical protein
MKNKLKVSVLGSITLLILLAGVRPVSADPTDCDAQFAALFGPTLPPDFLPVHSRPIDRTSIQSEEDADRILEFSRSDPSRWSEIIPPWVYTNAVVPRDTPLVRPLSSFFPNGTVFTHGTDPDSITSIARDGPLLTDGWGGVQAGFFLDVTGRISMGYEIKKGALAEYYIDPEALTFKWNRGAFERGLIGWIQNWENAKIFPDLYPEFSRLADGSPRSVSRDNLARSFGAKVLINETLYGQSLQTEVVILDPQVVKGYRDITGKSKWRRRGR